MKLKNVKTGAWAAVSNAVLVHRAGRSEGQERQDGCVVLQLPTLFWQLPTCLLLRLF